MHKIHSYQLTFGAASATPHNYCQHRLRGTQHITASAPRGQGKLECFGTGMQKQTEKGIWQGLCLPSTAPLPPHLSSSCGARGFFKKKRIPWRNICKVFRLPDEGFALFSCFRSPGGGACHSSPCNKLSNTVQRKPIRYD